MPPKVQPARITKWEDLTFGIQPTNGHVRYTWSQKTSAWDAGQFVSDPYLMMHIHAGVLHYGMSLFEGCKAFRCKDGKVGARAALRCRRAPLQPGRVGPSRCSTLYPPRVLLVSADPRLQPQREQRAHRENDKT